MHDRIHHEQPLIDVRGASLVVNAQRQTHILKDVSFSVSPGEIVAITGASGSGKTSLLMLLGGLQKATSGQVVVDGQDLSGLNEDQLAVFRRGRVAILFQNINLIPSLTAGDNVGLALEIVQPTLSTSELTGRSTEALRQVGLESRSDNLPAALSGGEQQRVGLARALVTQPKLLLADEPTGNLDAASGAKVIELMFSLARQQNAAVVIITHDPALAARADRTLVMTAGVLRPETALS
jgi:putative ABC transport system ATP-binding protein